jgi:hypothetical protein
MGETVFQGALALDVAHPAVEAGSLGLAVQLVLGDVLGVELPQEVGGHVGAHVATLVLLAGLPAAHGRTAGQDVDEEVVRVGELEDHGVIVPLVELALFAVHHELGMRRGVQVLVQIDVFVPEDEVIRREGMPVRPLVPLAEQHGDDAAVLAHLHVARHTGHDLRTGVIPEQDLVRGDDAVAVLAVAGAGEAATPGAAVPADAVHRLDHHGLLGNPLVHGRQLPLLHEVRQHGRLAELLRPLGGVQDVFRTLQLADQGGTELRLARLAGQGQGRGDPAHRQDP